ncbi:hypothetical protein CFBP3846_P200056 (plasmid) [Pseudomonas syringae pv. avii]|uniref:Uncharacterized protein n=1 Tax=Pseudomonas syringae pv. avii TaxID=663959 RepID=A0ABY1UFA5_PSESX|nr:hypothetical protein CFBP3846_P200056 [Pseudomonas syringae pv. avii]
MFDATTNFPAHFVRNTVFGAKRFRELCTARAELSFKAAWRVINPSMYHSAVMACLMLCE